MTRYTLSITSSSLASDGENTFSIFYDGDFTTSIVRLDGDWVFDETDYSLLFGKPIHIDNPQEIIDAIENGSAEDIVEAIADNVDPVFATLAGEWTIRLTEVKTKRTRPKGPYRLKGAIKSVPYPNYRTNETQDRCVLQYVESHYPRIVTKSKQRYFDKDIVTLDDVKIFTERYKIGCKIYDILGRSIYSTQGSSLNLRVFAGIIVNGHLYPHDSGQFDPKLAITKIPKPESNQNEIRIHKGGKIYNKDGYFYSNVKETDINVIDAQFFKGFPPNFCYKSEARLKPLSMIYTHPQLSTRLVSEIDMNKAYYTVAYSLIPSDSFYPIFTPSDLWLPFQSQEIDSLYYYLVSKDCAYFLRTHFPGIMTNMFNGFVLIYLMGEGYIGLKDIVSYKPAKLKGEWSRVISRIEALKLEGEAQKSFVVLNGCLGQSYIDNSIRVEGIDPTEYLGDEWEVHKDSQIRPLWSYRYLNTVNIYNHIIGHHLLYMFKVIANLKYLYPKAKIVKIRVDSIGLDCHISDPLPKHFKRVVNPKLSTVSTIPIIHDGIQINADCLNELKFASANNILYSGAPGTGKTKKVKDNHSYDFCCSTTNTCSIDIGGHTVYKEFGLYTMENLHKRMRKFKNSTVWIDEISMIQPWIWSYFVYLSMSYNTKFILSGDINQIPPISQPPIDIDSPFYSAFCGKITFLTYDHRNDEGIIQLRESIVRGNPIVTESTAEIGNISRHIVFTHAMRRNVNHYILNYRKYKFCATSTGYDVSIGVRLTPRKTVVSKEYYKGDIWEVTSLNSLTNIKTGQIKQIDNGDYRYMSLGFAITCHSAQGATITEPMGIHEWRKMMGSDWRIFYWTTSSGAG